jgi:hypothetical protein
MTMKNRKYLVRRVSKMKCLTLSIFVVAICILPAFGQSAAQLDQKYGTLKYYQVRPMSLLAPTFDAHGQICRAIVVPNYNHLFDPSDPVDADITSLPRGIQVAYFPSDPTHRSPVYLLDRNELKQIFDEFAPPASRKGNAVSDLDISGFGTLITASMQFENIMLNVRIAMVGPGKQVDMDKVGGDVDRFLAPSFGVITSAWINWTDRKCSEQ